MHHTDKYIGGHDKILIKKEVRMTAFLLISWVALIFVSYKISVIILDKWELL